MGELSLIQKFRAEAPAHPWIVVGPGHDCAVVRWPTDRDQAFKIDQVVEGTHFVLSGPGAATPWQVGWKAMAKTCSDIAACGFWPVAATVAVNLRRGGDEKIALELYEGLVACCRKFSIGLAGGDIAVSDNGLGVTVSLLGEGPKNGAWLRSGAKPSDWLLVTGSLGDSLRSGKHLEFTPRLEEARTIRQICGDGVHACIDITDGLSRDLHHLCNESDTGADVYAEKIPSAVISRNNMQDALCIEHALSDGEDFELLLSVDPVAAKQLLNVWSSPVTLTQIGVVQPRDRGCNLVLGNNVTPMPDKGYEHRT